jgi:transcription elongation factor GreB
MSRAFVKEDAAGERPVVPPRAPLPEGVPNLVTASGLRALELERQALMVEREALEAGRDDDAERARALLVVHERLAELEARLASAVLAPPPTDPSRDVALGAGVRVRRADGRELRFRIVGVDEADPGRGAVAFTAPLAAAVLGRRLGDAVAGDGATLGLTIVGLDYDEPSTPAARPEPT